MPVQQTPTAEAAPGIPPEWLDELSQLNPDSFEYHQMSEVLHGLGYEAVEAELGTAETPRGFKSAEVLASPARIPKSQFEGRIYGLENAEDVLSAELTELVSDSREPKRIRVCDLRPYFANQSNFAPRGKEQHKKLESAFWSDMRFFTDNGMSRNVVQEVPGVNYVKVGKAKLRTYWTLVQDKSNPDNVPTVAILASCGDGKSYEAKLYHRLFGKKLQ